WSRADDGAASGGAWASGNSAGRASRIIDPGASGSGTKGDTSGTNAAGGARRSSAGDGTAGHTNAGANGIIVARTSGKRAPDATGSMRGVTTNEIPKGRENGIKMDKPLDDARILRFVRGAVTPEGLDIYGP